MKTKPLAIAVLALLTATVTTLLWNTFKPAPDIATLPSETPLADVAPSDYPGAAERLAKSLTFKTVSEQVGGSANHQAEFTAFQQHLRNSFPSAFAAMTEIPLNNPSLLLKWEGTNSNRKPLLFLAHQDVVPASKDGWTHEPFAGSIADGHVWGRGAVDNKGALMALLEAIDAMTKAGTKPSRSIYLFLGHDEEIGGLDGARTAARALGDQGIRFDAVIDEGSVVIQQVMPGVLSDIALIGVAQKGYLTLKLSVNAQGGHSSMPPKELAVPILSTAITRLTAKPFPATMQFVEPMLNAVAPELGFAQRLALSNLWLFRPVIERRFEDTPAQNASIRTTVAPTMLAGSAKENVLPTEASALVNFRIMPGETSASVIAEVTSRIADPRIKITASDFNAEPSDVSSVTAPVFDTIRRSIIASSSDRPVKIVPGLVVATNDSRHFTDLADNVYRFNFARINIADLKMIHNVNERVAVDSYLRMIHFYRVLLANI